MRLPDDGREENPVNLDPRMAKLAGGVHRLDGQLMVVLDIDRVTLHNKLKKYGWKRVTADAL